MSLSLVITQIVNSIISGSMYALMAVGLSLLWGVMDVLNFSHGAFYMLGAYITYYAVQKFGLNLIVGILLSIIIAFLLGILTERVLIHPLRALQGTERYTMVTIIVTLGLAIFLEAFALIVFGSDYKSLPPIFPGVISFSILRVSKQMLFGFLLASFMISMLWIYLRHNRIGLAIQALAQQPEGALLMGINPNTLYSIVFGISVALAATAGALLAPIYNIYPSIGWIPFGKAWVIVVIGGLGSITGVIYAAFLWAFIESIGILFIPSSWVPVVAFGLMILVLVLRPSGLAGIRER